MVSMVTALITMSAIESILFLVWRRRLRAMASMLRHIESFIKKIYNEDRVDFVALDREYRSLASVIPADFREALCEMRGACVYKVFEIAGCSVVPPHCLPLLQEGEEGEEGEGFEHESETVVEHREEDIPHDVAKDVSLAEHYLLYALLHTTASLLRHYPHRLNAPNGVQNRIDEGVVSIAKVVMRDPNPKRDGENARFLCRALIPESFTS